MNIIICGAGRVGFTIAKQLSEQGHSITVVDQSSEFIQKINDTQDVKGVVGRATFPSVLEKAGAEDADMVIAVTQNDETNMVICQVAYSIFKIHKNIARIRGQEFLGTKWGKLYGESNLPIDVIISPELEVAKTLQRIKDHGKDEVILADEISPDTCRLWDSITDKKLDKDRFRKNLGDLIPAYTEVAKRLGILHEQSNVSAVNVTKLSSVKRKHK